MFHTVRLQPADSAKALAALGLKLKRKNGRDLIQQPCPAYRDCQCSIYQDRPQRCRLFECQQLKRLAAGEISEETAGAKIAEAVAMIARLHELFALAGETNPKGPLTRRYEKIMAELIASPAASEADGERICEQLKDLMTQFDLLLDQDFRT